MLWSACELLYLTKFQKYSKRSLDLTNRQSALRAETLRENSQPTARPGCLSTVAAITIPKASTRPVASVVLSGTYLVDEDRPPKLLDKFDDHPGILFFIEDPGHLPFLQQRHGLPLDVSQGPSIDDQLQSTRSQVRDVNRVNCSVLSASSLLSSWRAAATLSFNLISHGIRSPSFSSTSLNSWNERVSEISA